MTAISWNDVIIAKKIYPYNYGDWTQLEYDASNRYIIWEFFRRTCHVNHGEFSEHLVLLDLSVRSKISP